MTLVQPHGSAILPTVIRTQPNGAVDTSLLNWVEPNQKSLIFLMADLPARSMRAWHTYLAERGLDIRSSGRGRTLSQQWQIFGGSLARYRPVSVTEYNLAPSENRKTWPLADYVSSAGLPAPGRASVAKLLSITIPNSVFWIKIAYSNGNYPATAATPGTSNHGFWCADDLDEWLNGVLLSSIRSATLQVLYASGSMFGFTWSVSSEPWHVDWAHGDSLTQATIDYENLIGTSPQPKPPTPVPDPSNPPVIPVYDEDMPTLYQDSRFANVFLVNGDVTTVGEDLFNSLRARGVTYLVAKPHDQSLVSFMRKSRVTMAQMVPIGGSGSESFVPPADLL